MKFNLFEIIKKKSISICSGICENIGSSSTVVRYVRNDKDFFRTIFLKNHKEAFGFIKKIICDKHKGITSDLKQLFAIGHRVVHGGDFFPKPVVINDGVIEKIKNLIPLAPIHNEINLEGILDCEMEFPGIRQVAVFDTSFFFNLPEKVKKYPIPNNLSEKYHIRKYGFHGISHSWVLKKYADISKKLKFKIISCHLGSGSSVCAIKNGKPVDTSMGLTPLGGIMMATRSGSLDPSVVTFLNSEANMNYKEIDELLNKKSGLLGVSGISSDIRKLLKFNDHNCKMAIDMFVYRIVKYIGSYIAVMGGVDSIIFTGGIGENNAEIREKICKNFDFMGLKLDEELNSKSFVGDEIIISKKSSRISVLVIRSNEELSILNSVLSI